MSLASWGWSPALQQAFGALDAPAPLVPARVVRHDRTGYLVVHAEDRPQANAKAPATAEAFARLPGHLRDDPPAVGDWVGLDLRDPATIRALLPRRSAFVRQAAGRESRAQVVAANVDVVFLVAGLDGDLNLRRLERYLALAAGSGARTVIVLNKADLADDLDARIAEVRAIAGDVDVVPVSAATGAGVERVRPAPGETAAFLGSSGVGKSSLVNRLMAEDAMPTQGLRIKDGRGRHTTTARHLMQLPDGGIVLDTPGMRELHLWDAEEGIATVFADVEALAARCRFRDCAHDAEPGCAVREGVSAARLASWRKLQREAAASARRSDAAAGRAEARRWGKMGRDAMRAKRERLR